MAESPMVSRLKPVSGYILVAAITAAIWTFSADILDRHSEKGAGVDLGDLATTLFGAASVALFVFSILIALLAVFGWKTLQSIIDEQVEKETSKRVRSLEFEIRGRVLSIQGHVIGEMSLPSDTLFPKDTYNKDRLLEALDLCEQGYEYLKEVGGGASLLGLNNLVFYSCACGCEHKRSSLLKQANILKLAGQERNSADLLITSCRAILQYRGSEEEQTEAREILRALLNGAIPDISEKQRKEASLYLTSFPQSTPKNHTT